MLKRQILTLGLVLLGLHFSAALVRAQVISIDSKLASAKDSELVDQVRLKSWGYAKPLLDRLEEIDEKDCPSLRAFLHDVQVLTKQVNENMSPREWPEIDTDKLITSNIHFWKAMLESS